MRAAVLFATLALALGGCTRIGSRCSADSTCNFVDGGYCAKVQVCTVSCDDGSDAGVASLCPEGAACAHYARWVCLHACTSDGQCSSDEACTELSGQRVCVVRDPLKRPP